MNFDRTLPPSLSLSDQTAFSMSMKSVSRHMLQSESQARLEARYGVFTLIMTWAVDFL